MASNSVSPYSLDELFSSTALGSLDKAIGNNLYGINHLQTPTVIPSNKDTYGLTFFVRPQLNLQTDNIRNIRRFYSMLTQETKTIQNVTRCLLDPRMMTGYTGGYGQKTFTIPPLKNPIVDNENAFFPILTNNCNVISGWPDLTLPVWSSTPGLFKEVYSLPDGLTQNYGTYTLDATFRNTLGSPILYMFYIWLHYMSYVKKGDIIPYLDYLQTNTLDFASRIYRVVLDQQKHTVTSIHACGWCFPISDPISMVADFNKETPYNEQTKDITIRFQCHGFETMDDVLVMEFNKTVEIFKPEMRDGARSSVNRDGSEVPLKMQKLTKIERRYFKNRGYPRINPKTFELEWWLNMDYYKLMTGKYVMQEADFSNYENQE